MGPEEWNHVSVTERNARRDCIGLPIEGAGSDSGLSGKRGVTIPLGCINGERRWVSLDIVSSVQSFLDNTRTLLWYVVIIDKRPPF